MSKAFRPDDELRQQLLEIFAGEAQDELDTLSSGLVALEADPQAAVGSGKVEEMMRAAHSLKGSARAVELEPVDRISHALENLLRAEAGQTEVSGETADLGYRALDAIEAIVAAATGGPPAEVNVAAICDELNEAAGDGDGIGGRGAQEPPPTGTPDEHAVKAPEEPAPAKPAAEPPGQNATVRVSVAKLDRLVSAVRELESARVSVEHAAGVLTEAAEEADLAAHEHDVRAGEIREITQGPLGRLQRAARELSDDVNQARTVPLSLAFDPLPRAVRDLARDLGRDVELQVSGGEIDVDRAVLEVIRPALVHLVRNAMDHGIEPPAMRAAAGKPETGTLSVRARTAGSQLAIDISDDGAGIDGDAVIAKAIEAGMVDAAEAAQMDYDEIVRFVLRPAFSTRDSVSEISGRGVGLDAVFEGLTALQGSVDVASVPGKGTTVTLNAPLAIAATDCIVAEIGGLPVGIVLSDADRIIRLDEGEEPAYVQFGARRVPMAGDGTIAALAPGGRDAPRFAIVISAEMRQIALPVEAIRSVLRLNTMPLPSPRPEAELVRSAAILPDGDVLRIVDARALVSELPPPPRILVVDDSETQLERGRRLVVAAGYLAETASDGAAALEMLRGGEFDAVLADFEMPEVDGFEMTKEIRSDPELRDLPVVIWSASGGNELFGLASEAGADAFFMKGPEAQEEVPNTLQRLLSAREAP